MNRLACALLVLLVGSLASCGPSVPAPAVPVPVTGGAMIQPGVQVGDVVIMSGEGQEAAYTWEYGDHCTRQPGAALTSCLFDVGEPVNVSLGLRSNSSATTLDQYWSADTYQMYIQGRPVDLDAFGPVEIASPELGLVRHWNVVLLAKSPQQVTVYAKGVAGSASFEHTITYTFVHWLAR